MFGAAAKTRRVEAEEASRRDLSLKPEEADDDSIAPCARLAAHRFSWSRRRRKKSLRLSAAGATTKNCKEGLEYSEGSEC